MDFDAILAEQFPRIEVPQWKTTVVPVAFSVADAKRLFGKLDGKKTDDGTIAEDAETDALYCQILAVGLADEAGLFPFQNEKGLAFLAKQPLVLKQKLVAAVIRANGLDAEATEEKNLPTPAATSE